jgi:predicted  nucleic acid-binding Zn-ribbon protein
LSEIVSVKEQIRFLIQLQELDSKIYGLEKEKTDIPRQVAELQSRFDEKKANLKNLEEKEKSMAVKRKEKEIDLASKEENIRKLNGQLASLKSNKEYQAMLSQIASLKTDNSVLEEDILKIMDEQDAIKKDVAKEKSYLADEEKKFQDEKEKVDERLKEIEYQINDLSAKRGRIIPCVDKRSYALYERILKGKNGLALVKVKDYACQGCFIAVTPQVVNEIKMQDKIITCESCARILYLEEDI